MTAKTLQPPPPSTVHPDRAAMLRQIIEWPDDDAPRLVYADWLDEHGDHERAEFIRVGIEYAGLQKTCICGSCVRLRGGGQHHNGRCDGHYLRQQTMRLAMKHSIDWFALPGPPNTSNFDRGFVSMVQMECAAFMQHAASIFAAHPVTRVVLVDKRPFLSRGDHEYGFSWWRSRSWGHITHPSDNSNLPDDLFEWCGLLHPKSRLIWDGPQTNQHLGFHTESAAIDALSAACVYYGRELAGLRPIPQPIKPA